MTESFHSEPEYISREEVEAEADDAPFDLGHVTKVIIDRVNKDPEKAFKSAADVVNKVKGVAVTGPLMTTAGVLLGAAGLYLSYSNAERKSPDLEPQSSDSYASEA